jgi:predicted TIM-barrel fold metal-dependent hydrolase
MHNIHTHTWDQVLHFDPATVHEADRARGRPMDLTVDVNDLTHAVEDLGLRGLKLGPIYAGFDPRDACCEAHGLPILFHKRIADGCIALGVVQRHTGRC